MILYLTKFEILNIGRSLNYRQIFFWYVVPKGSAGKLLLRKFCFFAGKQEIIKIAFNAAADIY